MYHKLTLNTNTISKIISLLRFPLAFLVVMIHCNMRGYKCQFFNYSLQNIIFLAVPLFYMISGYNFIKSKKPYKQKIKDRFKTLLVPYSLWNIIAYIISIHLRKTLFHVDGFYFAIYIIFATISIIFILLRFNDKLSISQFPFNQGDKSFFIYCSHCILISGFSVYLLNKTCLYSELKIFISAIISVSICILLYSTLKKFAPSLLKILNGGRI